MKRHRRRGGHRQTEKRLRRERERESALVTITGSGEVIRDANGIHHCTDQSCLINGQREW